MDWLGGRVMVHLSIFTIISGVERIIFQLIHRLTPHTVQSENVLAIFAARVEVARKQFSTCLCVMIVEKC